MLGMEGHGDRSAAIFGGRISRGPWRRRRGRMGANGGPCAREAGDVNTSAEMCSVLALQPFHLRTLVARPES